MITDRQVKLMRQKRMEGSDTGNGSGHGWDERASAQVAEWPIAVQGNRSIGGALVPTPSTGCGRMRSSRCYGMIRLAS